MRVITSISLLTLCFLGLAGVFVLMMRSFDPVLPVPAKTSQVESTVPSPAETGLVAPASVDQTALLTQLVAEHERSLASMTPEQLKAREDGLNKAVAEMEGRYDEAVETDTETTKNNQ